MIENLALKHLDFHDTDRAMCAMDVNWPSGTSTGWHAHPKAQLLYAIEGVMVVRSMACSWVVPPNRALWLAAGVEHVVKMSGGCQDAHGIHRCRGHRSASGELRDQCLPSPAGTRRGRRARPAGLFGRHAGRPTHAPACRRTADSGRSTAASPRRLRMPASSRFARPSSTIPPMPRRSANGPPRWASPPRPCIVSSRRRRE